MKQEKAFISGQYLGPVFSFTMSVHAPGYGASQATGLGRVYRHEPNQLPVQSNFSESTAHMGSMHEGIVNLLVSTLRARHHSCSPFAISI